MLSAPGSPGSASAVYLCVLQGRVLGPLEEAAWSGVGPKGSGSEFLPVRVLGRWDEEIRAFAAPHPDGQVLASLATTDFPKGFSSDSPSPGMRGSIDGMIDYSKPF